MDICLYFFIDSFIRLNVSKTLGNRRRRNRLCIILCIYACVVRLYSSYDILKMRFVDILPLYVSRTSPSCLLIRLTIYSPDQPKVRVESILSEDEINLMRQRVELDRRDYVPDNLTGAKLRQYLSDGTIWVYGFLSMSSAM